MIRHYVMLDAAIGFQRREAAELIPNKRDEMNFSDALMCLKRGDRVARNGWNGKGMWLKLVPEDTGLDFVKEISDFGLRYLPWIGMKTADHAFVPWLASQTDILADDWVQIE